MPYPWTELRLTQAAEVAAEHGCACAVDVESLVTEVRRLQATITCVEGALRVTGAVTMLAQCPACRAERTNGEWHADDCPRVKEG